MKNFLIFLILLMFSCTSTNNHDQKESEPNKRTQPTEEKQKKKEPSTSNQASSLPSWPESRQQEAGKLRPFDQAGKDPSLLAFRDVLYQRVLEKDTEGLLEMLTSNVQFSVAEMGSKEGLIEIWELNSNPQSSGIWKELRRCLELGGGFGQSSGFFAPYLFVSEGLGDPYESGVIVGENVRLRDQPSTKGKILASLSWDLVEVQYTDNAVQETIDGETEYWVPINTANGEKGYVFGKYLRTAVDYRIGFQKTEKGAWQISSFVAGD